MVLLFGNTLEHETKEIEVVSTFWFNSNYEKADFHWYCKDYAVIRIDGKYYMKSNRSSN